MVLVGQYDSPYVRRVAVSLRLLGFPYEHDTRSVFADFDAMREVNPLGRIPSLVLDGPAPDGEPGEREVLVDSAAILDWLDETVGPRRALLPPSGHQRRRALQRCALATGAIDKLGAVIYESVIRPSRYRWPEWIERCRTQGLGALERLDAEPWDEVARGGPTESVTGTGGATTRRSTRIGQAEVTTTCLVTWLRLAAPELIPAGRFPALDRLADRCEELPEFRDTRPAEYAVPRSE